MVGEIFLWLALTPMGAVDLDDNGGSDGWIDQDAIDRESPHSS